jgi:hypothetical protein
MKGRSVIAPPVMAESGLQGSGAVFSTGLWLAGKAQQARQDVCL